MGPPNGGHCSRAPCLTPLTWVLRTRCKDLRGRAMPRALQRAASRGPASRGRMRSPRARAHQRRARGAHAHTRATPPRRNPSYGADFQALSTLPRSKWTVWASALLRPSLGLPRGLLRWRAALAPRNVCRGAACRAVRGPEAPLRLIEPLSSQVAAARSAMALQQICVASGRAICPYRRSQAPSAPRCGASCRADANGQM